MRMLALMLALMGASAMAAPQPHVDTDTPATAINPLERDTIVPCLRRQRPQRAVIVILRAPDGSVIAIGAIKVRQRC
jgi:hypothetical protein